ncbi:MAG: NADH-quinone oxidoreductase subunit J [Akkermansiaceae bacterium]|nr:NADH-quinone oxidoreductase subunit J [Akkermansiaceae bacterium]
MSSLLFWLFAMIMLAGGAAVVAFRNPVSCALSVVACFLGMAGLFVGLNAYFVAVIQILVYTGAVMVLFLFIIMLLDLKTDAATFRRHKPAGVLAGLAILLVFGFQMFAVVGQFRPDPANPRNEFPVLDQSTLREAAATGVESGLIAADGKIATALNDGRLPDTHILGQVLFTRYNLPLQILGTLLLVATVGVVVLSRREDPNPSD